MHIPLKSVKADYLFNPKAERTILLYGDFNVLNFLYAEKIFLGNSILIYPDSTAVHIVLRYIKKISIPKIISTDLQNEILKKAVSLKKKIMFFGDTLPVLSEIRKSMEENYDCRILVHPGYDFYDEDVLDIIKHEKPDVLFIGIGHGLQEKWIQKNYDKIETQLTIIAGGWFSYLAGFKKRAPLWMRKYNLEWLHKLIKEFPRVWKRYFVILPLFLYRTATGKINLTVSDERIDL